MTSGPAPLASGRSPWGTTVAIYLVAVLVFAGHLAFGANQTALSLAFACLWFATLTLVLCSAQWARRALAEVRLRSIALLFAAVVALAVLSLTPCGIGGPHPIWSYAPDAHASVSVDPYATLVEIVKLLSLAGAFLVGCLFAADDERAASLIRAIAGVGMLYCAWAFIDHALSPQLLFGGPRPFDPGRLSASFGSANTAATLFGSLSLLNLADAIRTFDRVRPRGTFHIGHLQSIVPAMVRPLLALSLSAVCLIQTVSRAGLLATVGIAIVLLGAMLLARSRRTAISLPLVATVTIVCGLLVAFVALNSDALSYRFAGFGADAVGRTEIFAAHWHAFLAAPWSGYGLGTFIHINSMIMNSGNVNTLEAMGAAHNVYIQWLEEAGVVGAAPMFAAIAVIAAQLVRGAIQRRRVRGWLMAILAILALFAIHGASDYALQTPSMALFLSVLLGIGVGLSSVPVGRR